MVHVPTFWPAETTKPSEQREILDAITKHLKQLYKKYRNFNIYTGIKIKENVATVSYHHADIQGIPYSESFRYTIELPENAALQFHYDGDHHTHHYFRLDLRDPDSLTHFDKLAIAFKEACIAETELFLKIEELLAISPELQALERRTMASNH